MRYYGPFFCSECKKQFRPHREMAIFDKNPATCGSAECQRKRKTRLQRERREKDHVKGMQGVRGSTLPPKQRRPTLPHAKGVGWGNAPKQRRSTMPQPPEVA